MARIAHTPWEPGYSVLTANDLTGRNPYNGYRLTEASVYKIAPLLAALFYQLDSRISQIQQHSKHME
jgi:hypothetical protein